LPFLCIFTITSLHAAGWFAAGLFVSKVVDTGSQTVLIQSHNCGNANLTYDDGQKSEMLTVSNKVLSDMNVAWNYAHACYRENADPLDCKMPRPQLNVTFLYNTTCPFPGLRLYSDNAAFSVDSGLLNSNKDLGINARTSDQVNYRRVTTCAPLNTTGFKYFDNATERSPFPDGDILEKFNFGPNPYYQ
jgi:hypothetical protein